MPVRTVSVRYTPVLIAAERLDFLRQLSRQPGIPGPLCPPVQPLRMSHRVLNELYSTEDEL